MSFLGSASVLLTRAVDGLIGKLERVDDIKPPPLWFNATRIGGELTPAQVAQVILQADAGYLWRLVDLARESRERDAHLHAVLSTLELSLVGMEIQVIPASDDTKDREIAAHVEQVFANFGPREEEPHVAGMPDLIQHLAGGYFYGHAVAELLYRKQPNGHVVPYAVEPVMPRRFIFDQMSSRLHFFDYAGNLPYPGVDLTTTYPGQFIQFTPIVLGSGPAREGLMHPLIWAALFRNWSIRDWMALAELAWKPWRIGYYDKEKYSSKADIDTLTTALQWLTTNGQTLLPKNVEMKVEWPQGKSGGDGQHMALCQFMADEMSKATLGQTMTTTSGSSLSQAKVHDEVRKDRRDAASRALSQVLRWQIAARTVRLNYGPTALVPNVVMVPSDVDQAALAELLLKLSGPKGLGVPVSLRWLYKMFGIPAPMPGDEVVGNPVPLRVPELDVRKRIALNRFRVAMLSENEDALREAMAVQEELQARQSEARRLLSE